MRIVFLILASAGPLSALADEGMWTFDNFPAAAVQKIYGIEVTPAWLAHVRLSTVRLANYAASFVSPEGLKSSPITIASSLAWLICHPKATTCSTAGIWR